MGALVSNNDPHISDSTLLMVNRLNNTKKTNLTIQKCPESKSFSNNLVNTKDTVFGIQLGTPLKIQECKKSFGYLNNSNDLEYQNTNTVCFKHANTDEAACSPITNEVIQICFPRGITPEMLMMGDNIDPSTIMMCMDAIIENGNMEGVQFKTRGIEAQDLVFDRLIKKYGKPIKVINKTVQNRFGAKFDALSASWEFDNLFITFSSVLTTLDKGYVTINTSIGRDARHRMSEEKWKDKIPL